ncbi:MAG: molybdopterin cofactor-binding domain-containing protein, partial [Thiohalocapsa sp.]
MPASAIAIRDGIVSHPASGNRSGFGALAAAAADQPVPTEPFLKEPSEFRLIGKARLRRKDGAAKCNGSAIFTQDVRLPNMLTAVVAHPPLFGAAARGFDDRAARAIQGVQQVVQIHSGVAVLGLDFWSAKRGRDALVTDWDDSAAFKQSSDEILSDFRKLAEQPSKPARTDGEASEAMNEAMTLIEAEYSVPYLAHAAPMECMDCVMEPAGDGGVRVINGEQFQTIDQQAIADVLGIVPERVHIEMLYAGGSFGRRANPSSDYLIETAQMLKASGGKQPVKLAWTREENMRAGWYRPLYLHRLKAGLDGNGRPIAWQQRIVGQSIVLGTAVEQSNFQDYLVLR